MLVVSLLFFYCFLPGFLGVFMNVWASPSKRLWWANNVVGMKTWDQRQFAATAFVAACIVFCLAGLMVISGLKFNIVFVFVVLLAAFFTGFLYLCVYWKIADLPGRYGAALKLLLVPAALVVGTVSKIYADAAIAEYTGIAPQALPNAQIVLALILTPMVWFGGVSLVVGYISIPLLPIMLLVNIFRDCRRKRSGDATNPNFDNLAIMALAFCAILLLLLAESVFSKSVYEPFLKRAVAFSSFHLPTTYCGLPEVDDLYVAPLADGRALLAIPDEKMVYRFVPVLCSTKTQSGDETKKLLLDFSAFRLCTKSRETQSPRCER
ncbi:hypothetical protein ACIPM0_25015 [Pseudomonas sichuanensis]|uniref:hypothetical protein n=1 Tax=Pseudomonas TaxID=286 RepID=UPI00382A2BF3